MYNINIISYEDNEGVKKLIHTVMPEFGAVGEGFAIVDPEVEDMYTTYSQDGYLYLVVKDEKSNQILGGAGIGPLVGAGAKYCELKKMYFLSTLRGKGYGKKLLTQLLEAAKNKGYDYCYIETLGNMKGAIGLYEKFGFTLLDKPLGDTGHFGCNTWYLKEL